MMMMLQAKETKHCREVVMLQMATLSARLQILNSSGQRCEQLQSLR